MRPIAILALVATATAAQAPISPRPSFTSESSELVVLPVTVVDRHGQFVADLQPDRFSVFDNDRPQPIALFSTEDTPVTVGLVVDDSRSMASKIGEVIAAALAFARLSNPHDEIFAIAFNDSVEDATRGRPLEMSNLPAVESTLAALRPDGRTALYDALAASIERVNAATRPRRVLIVISDGGDNASRQSLNDVLAQARASNVTIYTIGLFDPVDVDTNPGVLKSLAQTTGGTRFLPATPSELMQACQHIAREIRSGYTIGYVPPDHDGRYHRVRVEVHPDARIKVRTRPGYVAASQQTSR